MGNKRAIVGTATTAAAVVLLALGCASSGRGEVPTIRHRGPAVHFDDSGPARYVPKLLDAFDQERAMEVVAFIDRYYRAPANEGYEAVIDRLLEELRRAGFGSDPRLELEVLSEEMDHPAWTPRSASLRLTTNGRTETLHAFSEGTGVDRVMLPINAPSCRVAGPVALALDEIEEGAIFVTDAPVGQVMRRARQRGAAAVLSASLQTFNTDPTGQKRHLDAIQFRTVPAGTTTPVAQISLRSYTRIQEAVVSGEAARISFSAEVEFDERPLRTVVASIVGDSRPDEAVAAASHVQEPGACDNASGVAGLLESVVGLAGLLRSRALDWPSRTLVFLWGDEFDQSRVWLETTERHPIAGISSDMTGQSRTRTGAIALLERMPDPGALVTIPPDEHTPWGAGDVTVDDLNPNGLAVVARCAMNDVARFAGGWESADHPWEGGSDHDEFIERGIPAVLFWHFTAFAYHTSLDRLDMVDAAEIRRTQVALLATALAVADPHPGDLPRYQACLSMEEEERVLAAESAGRSDIAKLWKEWTEGARAWMKREML